MNTKKTKDGCFRVIVLAVLMAVLLIAGLFVGFNLLVEYRCRAHEMTVDKLLLEDVYFILSKYRETNGRWPETIDDAAKQPDMPMVLRVDSVFHRPWLYYPTAKPGSKEVLAAVPDVIRIHWLPFIGWQDAVLADGTFADFRSSAALHVRTKN